VKRERRKEENKGKWEKEESGKKPGPVSKSESMYRYAENLEGIVECYSKTDWGEYCILHILHF